MADQSSAVVRNTSGSNASWHCRSRPRALLLLLGLQPWGCPAGSPLRALASSSTVTARIDGVIAAQLRCGLHLWTLWQCRGLPLARAIVGSTIDAQLWRPGTVMVVAPGCRVTTAARRLQLSILSASVSIH